MVVLCNACCAVCFRKEAFLMQTKSLRLDSRCFHFQCTNLHDNFY